MGHGTLKIHSKNILPIIKKWLYTSKDIFLRELVSNSCDAMSKARILRDRGKITCTDEEFRVDITTDASAHTIEFKDSGVGMTQDEVEEYIACLAFSGAEEFVKKYQEEGEQGQIIGHFGLGFYSSFMVSDQVTIDTLSWVEGAQPALWKCDGSPDYSVELGKRIERGTTVTLYLTEEDRDFLKEGTLRSILLKHCRFLSFPIFLNGKRINDKEPLWVKPASECSREEYLDFYRLLYPSEPSPVFWVHLNVDYPFCLQGILYFPKITRRVEAVSSSVHLYCGRVFVSDRCEGFLPDYLTILRGVIDSRDIPLNVSRSSVQMDKKVQQLGGYISKKVSNKLLSLLRTDREAFIKMWPDIEVIVKLGVLQDPKFLERVQHCLIWQMDQQWMTLDEYLERNKEKTKGKIFYSHGDRRHAHLLEMYREQGMEVLHSSSHLDGPLMNTLESHLKGVKFQRVDGENDLILDKQREKVVLDDLGKTMSAHIVECISAHLKGKDVEVEARSFVSDHVPATILIDEGSRRMRDFLAFSGAEGHTDIGKKKFVVNTNNALIQSIYQLHKKNHEFVKMIVTQLYEIYLLLQGESSREEVDGMMRGSVEVLTLFAHSLEQTSS